MITTTKKGVRNFVQNCVESGVTHVVCSPGSRNAPLVIALDQHPEIITYVIHDERSAAFFALGLSQALGRPVGVTCTSGSAVVNYYPAVTEAYYQNIPLVVMSADRPANMINQGDGQTIMQERIFGDHVLGYMSIEENPEFTADINKDIKDLLLKSNGEWKGPVHFNFPLTEPLYETEEVSIEKLNLEENDDHQLDEISDAFISKWDNAERKMILVGQMMPSDRRVMLLKELASDPSVVVLTESTSNTIDPKFNHCIDRSLAAIPAEQKADFEPNLLITLGGAIVSKRVKEFLRNAPAITEHWNVSTAFPDMDTYFRKTEQVQLETNYFLQQLLNKKSGVPKSNFGSKWKQLDYLNQERLMEYKSDLPFSDFLAFDIILDSIPEDTYVHLANSTPVRYAQLFDPIKGITYLSNRGTSGIDGSVSTAVGFAAATPEKVNVVITGDVSFFYDSNALWNAYLGSNVKIVLINNSGGGIFRFIEGPSKTPQLEKYFEAKHFHSAKHLCAAFGLEYFSANDYVSVEKGMADLLQYGDKPSLLEVFTPNEVNAVVLRNFFKILNRS